MHFQILVEDQSGKAALDILIPKAIGTQDSYDVKAYKGIGRIPAKLNNPVDASKRILLDNLPRLLSGYGTSWLNYEHVVIVVLDLDDKCLKLFRQELFELLNKCKPAPNTRFCFAIEEGEAWFLGDQTAIKKAYPNAKKAVFANYKFDSICGTWELLADAIYTGGVQALKSAGGIGPEKFSWATNIGPHMDINNNQSPSFNYFLRTLREFSTAD